MQVLLATFRIDRSNMQVLLADKVVWVNMQVLLATFRIARLYLVCVRCVRMRSQGYLFFGILNI